MSIELSIPEKPWWETFEVITNKHPKQLEIYEDPHQFKVIAAGRGFGKTITIEESCIRKSLTTKIKRAKAWIVAPNNESVSDIYWFDMINRIKFLDRWNVNKGKQKIFLGASEKKKKIYVRNLGGGFTEISLKSAEAPNTLIGQEVHFLGIDEMWKISRKIWTQHLEPTLRRGKGELLVISTPNGKHDMFYELWCYGSKAQGGLRYNPKWASWQCSTFENPLYPEEYIREAELTLTPWEFSQQYLASFDTASNRVYSQYDYNKNTKDDLTLNHNSALYLTFDFNTSPMTCTVGNVRPGNPVYLQARDRRDEIIKDIKNNREKLNAENKLEALNIELEILKNKIPDIFPKEQEEVLELIKTFKEDNTNSEEFCKIIVAWLKEIGWTNKILIYGDSTGGSKTTNSDKTNWQIVRNAFDEWEQYHEYPLKNPAPVDRINAVNRLLRNGAGEIGMYIHRNDCKPVIRDLEEVDKKEGTDEVDKTRLERRGLNHCIEGVGYLGHRRFPIRVKNSFQFAWI